MFEFAQRLAHNDRGAGLVEYALLVVLIAVGSLGAIATVGHSTSDDFEQAAGAFDGTTATTDPQLTPQEKWAIAQQDYKDAIAAAKATKSAEVKQAKDEYNQAKKDNQALPKSDRKKANQEAKQQYNEAKSQANQEYKSAVQSAKAAKNLAKAEYNASR